MGVKTEGYCARSNRILVPNRVVARGKADEMYGVLLFRSK